MPAGDAEPDFKLDRHDWQLRAGQPDAISAHPRFARTPLDRRVQSGRNRRRRDRDTPRGDRTRIRHAAAVGIVPRDAEISIRPRRKADRILPKLLVRQIEQRPFGREHRPAFAIPAAFERQPLQVRRWQPLDPNHVDWIRGSKVDLEAAALLRGGDAQDVAADPLALGRLRVNQQVWNRTSALADEPKVGQTVFRKVPLAPLEHAKRRAGRQESGVDRQPVRARPGRHDGPLVGCLRRLLREDEQRKDRQRDRGNQQRRALHVAVLVLRTNFCSATDTSVSEMARPTNDATRGSPSSELRS